MKKIGKAFLLFPLLFSLEAFAKVEVLATVDRNKMNRGDALVLTVAVSSDESVNVSEPRLPNLNGFDLINKWSGTESRSTFTNGKFQTTRTRKFNYQLTAPQEGTFRILPIDVIVNGKAYKTKLIKVTVLKSGAPTQRQARGRGGQQPGFVDPFAEADDLFNQLLGRRQRTLPQAGQRQNPSSGSEELFWIDVEVDKKRVFEGEQVTASWYLYTSGQIRDIDTLKYPSLNGFWKEDIHVATHLNFQREVVNGVMVKRALLASYALFPIKPGKIDIDPYRAKITAMAQNIGFGFGRPVQKVKKSRVVKVQVDPLPPGKPDNFVGVVGNYRVTGNVEKRNVKVNQPLTAKIKFEGQGNAKLIELPNLQLPPELELYDTKKEAKFFKTGNSYKSFELLLIPRKAGAITLPSLAFSIFNTSTKRYEEIKTSPIALNIEQGPAGEVIPSAPLAKADAKPVKGDQRMPPALLAWESSVGSAMPSPLLWGGLFFLSTMGLLFRARQVLEWGATRKNLMTRVKGRFDKVGPHIKSGDYRQVGATTMNAVYYALGDVAGEGGANVQLDKLLLKVPPSVRRDYGAEILRLMESFQTLAFAPDEVIGKLKDKDNMKAMVSDIERLMLKAVSVRSGDSEEGKS